MAKVKEYYLRYMHACVFAGTKVEIVARQLACVYRLSVNHL